MFKRWRRKRLLARPFPDAWEACLTRNVRHYPRLPEDERKKLRDCVAIMVAEKEWVGCRGLEMTDEIKVTIAGQASLLLLGGDGRYVFDGVLSVLVHPDAFVTDVYMETFGEAWPRGPVVLSWRHVVAGGADPADGLNVVLHEFAHQLDGLDGEMTGTPPLGSRRELERWREVAEREYLRLVNRAERGQVSLLDQYGAANRAEFFAVTTECFFERPLELAAQHPELYALFRDFYRQDPAAWFRQGEGRPRPAGRERRQAPARDDDVEVIEGFADDADSPDACFARGVVNLQNGKFARALREFDRATALDPDDAELHHHRAQALFELGRYREAAAAADRAIALDPRDIEGYRMRALARFELGRDEPALEDWNRVVAALPNDAEARYERALTLEALGRLKAAVRDLTEAISLAPDWADPLLVRAEIHEALGEPEKAARDRTEAIRRDPDLEAKL
ncbi:MAG: zinc-dependent peptidase [Planctomycetes bacterium]|nr:zinc-dependent peptidase [Planctomycetota bacterium]